MGHTHGPLTLKYDSITHRIEINDKDGWPVAYVPVPPAAEFHKRIEISRVLAAAPELLKNLEIMVEYAEAHLPFIGNNIAVQDRITEARAVIAKAKGET